MTSALFFFIASAATCSLLEPVPSPPAPNAERYFTPSGVYTLVPDPETVVFRAERGANLAALEAEVPGLETRRLYHADQRIVVSRGDRTALERALGRPEWTRLAAFRLAETGALLVSDGWIRLRLHPLADEASVDAAARALGAERLEVFDRLRRRARFRVEPSEAPRVAEALHLRKDIAYAHPDFIYRVEQRFAPNDPLYPQQWHHALVLAEPAWDLERGDPSVRIAVIDSGVDTSHPDLAAKLVAPRDTENQDNDPSPEPDEAHGTACAGIAAATSNNDLGVTGMCQLCSLIPIRLFPGSGFTRAGADSDAMYWAGDNGASVISNSWGPAESAPIPFNLDAAITDVANGGRGGLGTLILFAAGNSAEENQSFELESHPLVLAIGATGLADARESYSNFGPDLDLMAPAAAVTTDNQGPNGYVGGDYIVAFGGTSAATPVVAGVAGLLLAADPTLTRGQLTSVLLTTADPVGGEPYVDGRNDFYGYGRVNAARSLELVVTGSVCSPVAEECGNGVDDDCDFLVDGDDPSCAPSTGELCGGPGGECQAGNVCLPEDAAGTVYRCFATCTDGAECGADPCVPVSSDLSICLEGTEVACPTCGSLQCDSRSLCVTYSELSLSLCTPSCTSSDECPVGFFCSPIGGGESACAPLSFSCSAFGPGAGSPCGTLDSCALGNVCLNDGLCYRSCATDADCPDEESCEDSSTAGLRYCDCACDASDGCDQGCACDRECAGSCQCDESDSCDPGCPCDRDCGCACDATPTCDDGCTCDPGCAGAGACACDATSSCDPDCPCDFDCGESGGGSCEAVSPVWWGALLLLCLARRRRRAPTP